MATQSAATLLAELTAAQEEQRAAADLKRRLQDEWKSICAALEAEAQRTKTATAVEEAAHRAKYPTAPFVYVAPPEDEARKKPLLARQAALPGELQAAGSKCVAIGDKVVALDAKINGTPLLVAYRKELLVNNEAAVQQLMVELLKKRGSNPPNLHALQQLERTRLLSQQHISIQCDLDLFLAEDLLFQRNKQDGFFAQRESLVVKHMKEMESIDNCPAVNQFNRPTTYQIGQSWVEREPYKKHVGSRHKLEMDALYATSLASLTNEMANLHSAHSVRTQQLFDLHQQQVLNLHKHHDAEVATIATEKSAAAAASRAAAASAEAARAPRTPAAESAAHALSLLATASRTCTEALGATQSVAQGFESPIAKTTSKLRALELQRNAALGMASSVQAGLTAVTAALDATTSARDETSKLSKELDAVKEELTRERATAAAELSRERADFAAFRMEREAATRVEQLNATAAAAAADITTTALTTLQALISGDAVVQTSALAALSTPSLAAHVAHFARGIASAQRLLDERASAARAAEEAATLEARRHAEEEHAAFLTRAATERAANDQTLCGLCCVNTKDIVIDCGHVACGACVAKLDVCPMCRVPISGTRRFFL